MSEVDRWYPNAYGEMQDYPTGEYVLASDYDALRARLAEAEELVGDMVGVLRGHRFCGDDFPSNGWSEVNAVLARYAKFTRRPVNGDERHG